MPNDSTNAGQVSSEQDTTPINDGYFADMQGDGDAFFGPEQLAQASAGGAPVVVPVPQDQNVIRVQVTPGEILELSSPFDPGVTLLGREADGNLAIRVGDVTVILVGFVEANAAAPVLVETSDGQPIDIAVLLASTDPAIDIQTAAGPGEGPQGQGADNTGGLLTQFGEGTGLGGLNAVGGQDATELSYGNIDNAIRLDREDALTTFGATAFRPGMGEAFLHDPIITYNEFQGHFTFEAFRDGFTDNANVEHDGFDNDWADNDGTFTEPGDITNLTAHSTLSFVAPTGGSIHVDLTTGELEGQGLTSNGVPLKYVVSDDGSTVFAFRGDGGKCGGDGALIFVVHLNDQASTSADVVYFLVNRLDHATPDDPNDSVRDLLSIDVGFQAYITPPEGQGEGSGEGEGSFVQGTVGIGFEDDVPVAHEVNYTSYYGNDDAAPDDSTAHKGGKHHGHESFDSTADGKAYVDEDWVKSGNKDHDNNPSSSNSDPAHGDEVGRAIAKGNLNIDFGADGPSGADGNDCSPVDCEAPVPLKLDTSFEAGFVDDQGHVLGADGQPLKSGDNYLYILSDCTDEHGIEHLVVGYTENKPTDEGPDTGNARSSDLIFTEGGSGCEVPVFELTLDVNPDDTSGKGMHFQDFQFELFKGIDQDPNTPTTESNTNLQFKVIGHDDDGDAVHTAINVQVNDDSPTINYISGEGANVIVSCQSLFAALGDLLGGDIPVDQFGLISSHDKGYVDEDWVNGFFAQNEGNADQDNTVPGSSSDKANGDDVGLNLVVGKVDFGADGPSATKIAELDVLQQGDVYTDKEGNTYTSGDPDKKLVVLFSNENFLVVGTEQEPRREAVVATDDGLPVINGNVVFVVAMDNDPSHTLTYGGFVFYLNGAIDHAGQNEQNLIVHVGITAEDGDGDSIDAINIQVNDDKPEVCITYCNEDPGSIGVITAFGASTKHDTDFGRVDEDWQQAPRGDAFIAIANQGNQDRAADGSSNANLFGDDYGSTHFSGQIRLNYGADGPGSQTLGLAELTAATDADGNPLTTAGGTIPLVVLEGQTANEIRIGYDDGETVHTVFLLTLNTTDNAGHFDFTQFEVIDHPIHSAVEDNVYLNFKAGSITDGDGDTVDAVIKVQVNDDTPEASVVYRNNDGVQSNPFGTVDEDRVLSGTGNNNTDSTPGDTIGDGAVFFDVTAGAFGADGPGAPGVGFAAQEDDQITVTDDNGDAQVLKTADGHTVLIHVEPVSSGFHLLVGYFNSDDSVGYVDGTSTEVFTVSMDTVQSRGQFNLDLPLQHSIADIEDNLMLTFGFNTGLTDGDGDPAIRIAIKVNDDGPEAVCDRNTSVAGKTIVPVAPEYQGNVLDNDKLGADGAVVTMINDTAVTAAAAGIITSPHGDLEIHQDGNWVFHPKVDETGGCVEFCYTITDGDGDTSTATLTIDYVGPTHNVANLNGTTTEDTAPGGHTLEGAGGNDLIYGYDGGDTLRGKGGDDILVGGAGKDTLHGNGSDDTLFGGNNDDNLHGDAGHDAMSGGAGDDTFHDVDANDLDGTNTLDGVHSIDGGDGTDTVQLGGLTTFYNGDAARLENVEVLDFKANSNGDNAGTAVGLSYYAVYGITQVGGLHALTIHADKTGDPGADSITLAGDPGHSWTKTGNDGTYDIYTAGVGAAQVTVHVDQDSNVVTGP